MIRKKKSNYSLKDILAVSLIVFPVFATFVFINSVYLHSNRYQKKVNAAANLTAWNMFNGDSQRSGINTNETAITSQNANTLQQQWQITLPDDVDSAPVELPQVSTPVGIKNVLYLTSKKGILMAVDSDSGTVLWQKKNLVLKYTTSSPAIEPSGQFIYSYALDGKIHKYATANGSETIDGIWPITINLSTSTQKGSSSINITNNYLYMTVSSYPVNETTVNYNGYSVAVNLTTGALNVFNTECSNIHELLTQASGSANFCPLKLGGVWARGGVVIDPVTQNAFVTSGNGLFDANTGGPDYGDSVIELTPDLSQVIDSYTPNDFQKLQDKDLDLGISATAMLPMQQNTATPYLTVVGGKEKVIRLLNRQNLSGQAGPGHLGGEIQTLPVTNGCIMFPHPLAWNDATGITWVFVSEGCGLYAYKVINSNNQSSLQLIYQNPALGGSSAFMANNILFIQGKTAINALDPISGTVLWSTPSASLHWQSPIVVNGHLYVTDDSKHLTAYGLPATGSTPTPNLTPTPSITPSTNLAYDDFDRNNQPLWGTAADGNIWNGGPNTNSAFSILNLAGTITGSSGTYQGYLGPQSTNSDLLTQTSISNINSNNVFGSVLRWNTTNSFYNAYLDGASLYIIKRISGARTQLARTNFAALPNTSYSLRFDANGTTVSAKVWPTGQTEPANWILTATDTSLTSGYAGIRILFNATNSASFTSFVEKQL